MPDPINLSRVLTKIFADQAYGPAAQKKRAVEELKAKLQPITVTRLTETMPDGRNRPVITRGEPTDKPIGEFRLDTAPTPPVLPTPGPGITRTKCFGCLILILFCLQIAYRFFPDNSDDTVDSTK